MTKLWDIVVTKCKKGTKKQDSHSICYQGTSSISSSRPGGCMDYNTLANSCFVNNVIAHRAINMIAKSASAVDILLYKKDEHGNFCEIKQHAALRLLKKPTPTVSGVQFLESLFMYQMISGNAYVYLSRNISNEPFELQLLRPDRVVITVDRDYIYYTYSVNDLSYDFFVNKDGFSDIFHFKNFHPLNDWYGLSSLEPALNSIEQHNKCIAWNKSLLENGARPSGAMVVKNTGNNSLLNTLSDEQFSRLKCQINEQLNGSNNAGKVMLLDGGLEWQDMSINPRDMDFIETKNGAARDISLSIGVPPQMLGIPGDNTYSNMSEARIAFWEETVVPLLRRFCDGLSSWLSHHYDEELFFAYDADDISALNAKRQMLWSNLQGSDFLTSDEKRQMLGFGELNYADQSSKKKN